MDANLNNFKKKNQQSMSRLAIAESARSQSSLTIDREYQDNRPKLPLKKEKQIIKNQKLDKRASSTRSLPGMPRYLYDLET